MAFSFLTLKKVTFFYNDLGVQDSSIVYLGYQDNFRPVYLFF